MRTFTLDSSCIDAINEGRAEVQFIRMLADAHTAGKANVALVALSVAGKHQAGSYFDDLDAFRDHLAALDLAHLDILKPMSYFDISFSDWCIDTDDTTQALEKKIHDVLFPQSRSEEHTSELQSRFDLVCRLLLEKKNTTQPQTKSAANLSISPSTVPITCTAPSTRLAPRRCTTSASAT